MKFEYNERERRSVPINISPIVDPNKIQHRPTVNGIQYRLLPRFGIVINAPKGRLVRNVSGSCRFKSEQLIKIPLFFVERLYIESSAEEVEEIEIELLNEDDKIEHFYTVHGRGWTGGHFFVNGIKIDLTGSVVNENLLYPF